MFSQQYSQRFGLSLLIVIGCLPQLMTLAEDQYQSLTNVDGMKIEAQILGFSLGQGAPRKSTETLTAAHLVHLIVRGNSTLYKVELGQFDERSQALLKRLNAIAKSEEPEEEYLVLANKKGVKIEAGIRGFSLGLGTLGESVDTLTAAHLVHLIVRGNSKPYEVVFGDFDERSQRVLKTLNENVKKEKREGQFWNYTAVQATGTLLDAYFKIQESGADLDVMTESFRQSCARIGAPSRNEPLVRYATSLINARFGQKAGSALDSVIRAHSDYWPAWRASVYVKLTETNTPIAAGKLKLFHKKVMAHLRATKQYGGASREVVENLAWINEVVNVFSTNDAANKIIGSLADNPEAASFLVHYQRQIAVENAAAQAELQRRAEKDRERIDALIVVANKEYDEIGGAIQREYFTTKAKFDENYPEYTKLLNQAEIARSRANAERNRAAAADSKVDAQRNKISALRTRRDNEEIQERKDDLNDEINAEERVLRADEESASAADDVASAEASAAAAVERIAFDYYASVLAPLVKIGLELERKFFVFSTRFRAQYADAIFSDPKLKNIFDEWDTMIERMRKARLGVSRANTINRKNLQEAAKAKEKEEAFELLRVLNFSLDEEIQTLSNQISARSQAVAR
jgi:hypothetical protein